MHIEFKTTTAQAVDVDLADGQVWQKSNRARKLTKLSFVGGAAAEDAGFNIMFGSKLIAWGITNFSTASQLMTTDHENDHYVFYHSSDLVCPAGTPIHLMVTNAFPAQTYMIYMEFAEQ